MPKITFQQLSNDARILKMTVPHLAPVTKNPDDETFEQIVERQNKFLALPEKIKDKLTSVNVSQKIQQVAVYFNLGLLQMADISRAIRAYYFGEIKLEDMPAVLAREIPIDMAKAQEISRMIIQKIINDNSVEEASQAKLVQMTVADALKAYPEVGEQLITSEKIVLKNFPDPVRPCLKNWLADFTFTLGRDKHTAMDRGIYLFQSANGKRLNSQDRNKLAYVLKAFDENMPVTINKDTKQIVFEPATSPHPPTPSPNAGRGWSDANFGPSEGQKFEVQQPLRQNSQSADDLHSTVRFSSPQKLPYEKVSTINTAKPTPSETPVSNGQFNLPKTTPSFRFNPVSGIIDDSQKEKEELQNKGNHINRKNIVNLKDN